MVISRNRTWIPPRQRRLVFSCLMTQPVCFGGTRNAAVQCKRHRCIIGVRARLQTTKTPATEDYCHSPVQVNKGKTSADTDVWLMYRCISIANNGINHNYGYFRFTLARCCCYCCSNGPQKCSACIKEDIFEDPTSILKQGCVSICPYYVSKTF